MLDRYLEDLIDPESIRNEDVLVGREDGIFVITGDKGCVSIKQEGNKWKVGYGSIDIDDFESIYTSGENSTLDEWHNDFQNTETNKEGYTRIPFFDKTLSFEDAYELSAYILSKILPKGCNQNRMIN